MTRREADHLPGALVDTSTGRRVALTRHARGRIAEMDVALDDVLRAALEPDLVYAGTDRSGRTEVRRRHDSALAVVVTRTHRPVVVSVLWNTTDRYVRQEATT